MKKVIVIGAGGHGRVVSEIVRAAGDEVVGFLDDAMCDGVLGTVDDCVKYPDAEFVIAIGNADVRERISHKELRWYTAIHPSAVISPAAVIGEGTVVMANVVVNNGAVVGSHCILNTGAIVEHDDRIDSFAHISVGARLGGSVSVGRSTWVGIGAVISNCVCVCGGCMIGAGAVVVRDITEPGTYIGVPARYRKS